MITVKKMKKKKKKKERKSLIFHSTLNSLFGLGSFLTDSLFHLQFNP